MNEVISLPQAEVDVLRTRRKKTMALRVRDGRASVLVPALADMKQIESFVQSKQQWITGHLLKQVEQQALNSKSYISGENFSYLGEQYPFFVYAGTRRPVSFDGVQLSLSLPESLHTADRIRSALELWYRKQAETLFHHRTQYYADLIGVQPKEIKVRAYKARWGSCTSRGVISYNWKLVMAPDFISDYVVVHELCHLIHPNHSKDFWDTVGSYMANYKRSIQWLKKNGGYLEL